MTRTDAKGRLQRIEMLATRLKQDAPCAIADLARQHGVSPRTIGRDLALMREQGLPIAVAAAACGSTATGALGASTSATPKRSTC